MNAACSHSITLNVCAHYNGELEKYEKNYTSAVVNRKLLLSTFDNVEYFLRCRKREWMWKVKYLCIQNSCLSTPI